MEDQHPMQSSNPFPAPKSINDLPTELLRIIAQYLAVDRGVTTRGQTVQRRQNLRLLCLVSKRLCPIAARALYESVHIAETKQLGLFFRAVESLPELGQLVRKLSVNLGLCWRKVSRRVKVCDQLYEVLKTTTRLQSLSLDLQECTDCFRIVLPEDAGRSHDVYDSFYKQVADHIRNDLNAKAEHRTFLQLLEEFSFTSNRILYKHYAFFLLPSLKNIISMRDKGRWSTILDLDKDIGIWNPHIKQLSLRSSALIPSEAYVIPRSFPRLEEFEFSINAQEMNRQVSPGGLTEVNPDRQSLSATLAKMPHLSSLVLRLHFPRATALPRINFPMHLGPAGGITSLGGLRNLTYLQIGMNSLMGYRDKNGQPQAQPLPPSLLPPNLERLDLSTCLSCWDSQIASLSPNAWQQTLPSYPDESTLTFIKHLAAYVSAGPGLSGLTDVSVYSQEAWWLAHPVDYKNFGPDKVEGPSWDAGRFEESCGISRFEKRTPRIHFRAYETDEYGCGQHQPYQPYNNP